VTTAENASANFDTLDSVPLNCLINIIIIKERKRETHQSLVSAAGLALATH